MNKKVLIVEDEFVQANDLQIMLGKAGYGVCGIARSVAAAQEIIKKERPGLVLLDIFLKGKETGIDLAKQLGKENIAFIYLSANSNEDILNAAKATEPYGFLVKPYREKDLLVMLEIARYRHEHSIEAAARRENVLRDKLSGLGSGTESWDKKLFAICQALQSFVSFDYITAGFNTVTDPSSRAISFLRIGFDEYQRIGLAELSTMSGLKANDLMELIKGGGFDEFLSDTFKMRSCTSLPLQLSNGSDFNFSFYSRKADTYNTDNDALFGSLQKPLMDVVENIFSDGKNSKVLSGPTSGVEQGAKPFEGVVGKSHLLLNVLDLVTKVAPSTTSVLILGESGTGKERIADCIHELSPRRSGPFVKVNCATLPPTLIESELFGHEKGSFTGAMEKRIGKFEKANKGTIFLDEIGEMPPDLQVKLLRVLQEKYIERIGSNDPTPIDVRVIAATNRNLEKEVAEGRFRLDLYYRLSVFPVMLPALRERAEDICELVNYFIGICNQKTGKQVGGVSDKALNNMLAYHWPGNIRELENVIERSVLLATGSIIEDIAVPLNMSSNAPIAESSQVKSIHEN